MVVLGIDLSTQSVKGVLLDTDGKVLAESSVVYSKDLSHYETTDGVIRHSDGLTVTQPVAMFVEAIDLLFHQLFTSNFDPRLVKAVSASGQQHAPVFWSKDATTILSNLSPSQPLVQQLSYAFTHAQSPIWMDSSTTDICRSFESTLGGPASVAEATGSRAFERFTAHQISKVLTHSTKDQLSGLDRIGLVSSFVATLLSASHAGIDLSDGSGMNLLDLRSKTWSEECLEACVRTMGGEAREVITVPRLKELLGVPIPSYSTLGPISPYFTQRYGLSSDCVVVASSGDNPCTLASMHLAQAGSICLSLGTSDTVFALTTALPTAREPSEGHVFLSPIHPEQFMTMLVFKNGALTRAAVRDTYLTDTGLNASADSDKDKWEAFEKALADTVPGNDGYIAFRYRFPEITPAIPIALDRKFGPKGESVSSFPSPAHDIRGLIEGQAMSARTHLERLGCAVTRIHATGGGAASQPILQIYSDVFGVAVYRLASSSGGAALGAALRAQHALQCSDARHFIEFGSQSNASELHLVCQPNLNLSGLYSSLLDRFKQLEALVVEEANNQ